MWEVIDLLFTTSIIAIVGGFIIIIIVSFLEVFLRKIELLEFYLFFIVLGKIIGVIVRTGLWVLCITGLLKIAKIVIGA